MTTILALIHLGRELRRRPPKPADRACRIGDLMLSACDRAAIYRALGEMALLDEDEATGEAALHLHDEGCRLEDVEASARLAWGAHLETLPRELVA